MRIATLGGAGFIGSHLARRFLASGDDVRIGLATDRTAEARLDSVSIALSALDDYPALIDEADLVIYASVRLMPPGFYPVSADGLIKA